MLQDEGEGEGLRLQGDGESKARDGAENQSETAQSLESVPTGTLGADVGPSAAPDEKMPDTASFVVVLFYSVLTVAALTIAIPTNVTYAQVFGFDPELGGLIVGLVPFASALAQPIVYHFLGIYEFKRIILVCCVINMVGASMYALAQPSGSFATLAVARFIQGSVGGPSYLTTYVSQTTSESTRSKYMVFVSTGISVGYGLGPLLGLVTEVIANAANIRHVTFFNSNTLPGYVMMVLFAIEAVLVAIFLQPLPPTRKPQAAGKGPIGPSTLPWSKIAWFYFQVVLIPFNVAGWEVVLVLLSTMIWGWSIALAAGILGAVNLIVALTTVLKLSLRKCVKGDDTAGNIISFALSAFAAILFFQYPTALNATMFLFCIGGFITLFAMQNAKGFTFALNSKWSGKPMERKRIMMINNMFYMGGRGLGVIIAPYVTTSNAQAFGAYLLILNLVCVSVAIATRSWQRDYFLERDTKSESQV